MPKFVLVSIVVIMLAAIPLYFFLKKDSKSPEPKVEVVTTEVPLKKPKQAVPTEVIEEGPHTITRENSTPAKNFSDISGIWNEMLIGGYTSEIGFEFHVDSKNVPADVSNTLTLKNNMYRKTYNKKVCDSPVTFKANLKFNSEGEFALEDTDFEGCENFYFTPNEVKTKNATFYRYEKNYLVLVMNDLNTAIVFKRQR